MVQFKDGSADPDDFEDTTDTTSPTPTSPSEADIDPRDVDEADLRPPPDMDSTPDTTGQDGASEPTAGIEADAGQFIDAQERQQLQTQQQEAADEGSAEPTPGVDAEDATAQMTGREALLSGLASEQATAREEQDAIVDRFESGVDLLRGGLGSERRTAAGRRVSQQQEAAESAAAASARLSGAASTASELPLRIQTQLEEQIEEETGEAVDLSAEDIDLQMEDGELSGTLSETGRQRVAVETAPIVGAADVLGVGEQQARTAAAAAFEFQEFGRTQREELVEPRLEDLREATGLEEEIVSFERFQESASAAEEEFLRPARDFVAERTPGELAAGAVAVGTRGVSLTPAGRLAVGGALVGGVAAETLESLPPEQQLAVGETLATVTTPGTQAERALTAEVGDFEARADVPEVPVTDGETQRGEMVIDRDVIVDPETGEITIPDVEGGRLIFPPEQGGELPPDIAGPEIELPIEDIARRESIDDAVTFPQDPPLPIEEDPIFLPELLPTTDPDLAQTGRFTGPEVPVDVDEPTEPFGGAEVPIEDEDLESAEDFVLPGPEVPTPGEDAADEFPEPGQAPPVGATAQQAIQRQRGIEGVVRDPADIGSQTGPGGPAFIKRQSPRVDEPFIIETPRTRIDLARVSPELARVLREGPQLTAEDVFESTLPGTEATGRLQPSMTPALGARLTPDQAPGLAESVDLGEVTIPALDTETVTVPDLSTPTTTTPTVTGPDLGTPTVTGPGFQGPGFTTPTEVVTESTAAEQAIPGILPDSDEKRRRKEEIDEFEKEFEEDILTPAEALGSDDGLGEGPDLSNDPT